ncbi:hypothetical protein N7U66_11255 [Lacinutrix neustonica]|uniref:Adhesin domain-containing protein n=1 Tax=Lacinutrix neustonica TaxID=2980107 RepID=A0A9E8MSW4_9FLAO|nr:hypothetical protein [Lacinutrix neustonica]WAC00838.1 hypothetical protein N7U66_11255 [Lacinutrix neustonica]
MNKFVFVIFLSLSLPCQAQKVIEQSIENTAIKTVVIIDDAIFKIKIATTPRNKGIQLESKIDGEYAKDIILLTEMKNDTLFISSMFQPFFESKNDKLSAHKIVSVELVLVLPENLSVYAKSAIASAKIKGRYKRLTLEFAQGNTTIKNFIGEAIVNSVNGDIAIESNYALVKTSSKTGVVKEEPLNSGIHHITLNTINGNISVTKTKK